MFSRLARPLEVRVLEAWSGRLGVALEALDRDGTVVVPDPREHAAARRATLQTVRGTFVLAAPGDIVAASTDPAGYEADVAARQHDNALFHYLATSPGEPDARVRTVNGADRKLLEELHRAAPSDEVEEADVDVDHPLAVGIVESGRLVAIASLLDEGEKAVDVGVLVHPDARGRGLGAAVVNEVARRATRDGLLVQYRCATENHASARLAQRCGFAAWGLLTVAPRDSG